MNEIYILTIKFIGQGAFISTILQIQAKDLLKSRNYCDGRIKRK